MACDCRTTREVIRRMNGQNVVRVVVESVCEPVPIASGAPGEADARRRQEQDSGVFGCRVTYRIRNVQLNDNEQRSVTSFSTGDDVFVFDDPIAPGEETTIEVFTDKQGGDCQRGRTGALELSKEDDAGYIRVAGILVCIGIDRE